jgi:hypothetical protein
MGVSMADADAVAGDGTAGGSAPLPQKEPGNGAGTGFAMVGFGIAGIDSALKSLTILLRGFREVQNAWLGCACMTLQENGAAAREIIAAPNVGAGMRIAGGVARQTVGRCASRGFLLALIGMRALEDAADPLWRRASRTAERVSTGSAP